MFLIDISYPAGALSEGDRSELAEAIAGGLTDGHEAPEETLSRARAMTHVAFREMQTWTTGSGPVQPSSPQPIVVTMTVPQAWREEMSRHGIGVVRAAVNRLDKRHGWSRSGGDVWINVVGVADGSIGLNGKPTTAEGVVEYMTAAYRARGAEPDNLPDGVVVDPICGMHVRLGRNAITIERNGSTIGFCSRECRDVYVRRNS